MTTELYTDGYLQALLYISEETILNRDEYCVRYICSIYLEAQRIFKQIKEMQFPDSLIAMRNIVIEKGDDEIKLHLLLQE